MYPPTPWSATGADPTAFDQPAHHYYPDHPPPPNPSYFPPPQTHPQNDQGSIGLHPDHFILNSASSGSPSIPATSNSPIIAIDPSLQSPPTPLGTSTGYIPLPPLPTPAPPLPAPAEDQQYSPASHQSPTESEKGAARLMVLLGLTPEEMAKTANELNLGSAISTSGDSDGNGNGREGGGGIDQTGLGVGGENVNATATATATSTPIPMGEVPHPSRIFYPFAPQLKNSNTNESPLPPLPTSHIDPPPTSNKTDEDDHSTFLASLNLGRTSSSTSFDFNEFHSPSPSPILVETAKDLPSATSALTPIEEVGENERMRVRRDRDWVRLRLFRQSLIRLLLRLPCRL